LPAIAFVTDSADQTRSLGANLGRLLSPGTVVLLHGDLGAGKTTLTQGIALGLGIHEPIQSPTFTLVAEHKAQSGGSAVTRLYHLDLYRLAGADDLDSIGWDQYLSSPDAVVVVEWPERAGTWLPDEYLLVNLEPSGPDQRRITIEAVPPNGGLVDVIAAARHAVPVSLARTPP
jgi:tRNA threonylcarbamoyladenosine biosynthesis protein TsaE